MRTRVRRERRRGVDVSQPRHIGERLGLDVLERERGGDSGAKRAENTCERQFDCVGLECVYGVYDMIADSAEEKEGTDVKNG